MAGGLVAGPDLEAGLFGPVAGQPRQRGLDQPATPPRALAGWLHREVLQVAEPPVPANHDVPDDEPGQVLAHALLDGILEHQKRGRVQKLLETREVPGVGERALLDADHREQVRRLDGPERRFLPRVDLAHSSAEGRRCEEYHGATEKDLTGPAGSSRMFKSGAFVADHLGDVDPEQVQPNGVDLRLGAVLEFTGTGQITRSGKTISDREPLDTVSLDDGDREGYHLDPGGYVLEYAEPVTIPEGHVGFVLPRSSLMRNGAMLNTAVWDAGYSGRGEGLLQVHNPLTLETGARVAQLVLAVADHEEFYDGDYQGERLS